MHPFAESDFGRGVTLSRWQSSRNFLHKSAATWWGNMKRLPHTYAAAYTSSWSIVHLYQLDSTVLVCLLTANRTELCWWHVIGWDAGQ